MDDAIGLFSSPRLAHINQIADIIPLLICLCLAVAGWMMLFYPERAFRSDLKPRWIGLPLLLFGAVGAFSLLR